MANNVKFEKNDEGIALVTISRPEALNALNKAVIEELAEVITAIENDEDLRVMILTGDGRSFVAGADIGEQSVLDVAGGLAWGIRGSKLFKRIEDLTIPTIAAVNGFALGGGCELAMACDIIIASEKAKFGQPEVGLGITPGFSGTQRLVRRVGIGQAKELLYTGDMIKADKAKEIGLVNDVYAPEELIDKAYELARRITKNAPIAVRYTKNAVNRGVEAPMDEAIRIENDLFAMCFATEDQKEGMNAFLEKRDKVFKNK